MPSHTLYFFVQLMVFFWVLIFHFRCFFHFAQYLVGHPRFFLAVFSFKGRVDFAAVAIILYFYVAPFLGNTLSLCWKFPNQIFKDVVNFSSIFHLVFLVSQEGNIKIFLYFCSLGVFHLDFNFPQYRVISQSDFYECIPSEELSFWMLENVLAITRKFFSANLISLFPRSFLFPSPCFSTVGGW